jgi:hypothetical protein
LKKPSKPEKNRVKPEKNRAKPKKTKSNQKNRVKLVFVLKKSNQTESKLVGLNRFWFGVFFFKKKILIGLFIYLFFEKN